jgi:hypothetical protein
MSPGGQGVSSCRPLGPQAGILGILQDLGAPFEHPTHASNCLDAHLEGFGDRAREADRLLERD